MLCLDCEPSFLLLPRFIERIQEMFRDCKTGGYNLEGTGLIEDRLIKMILLMTIAYSRDIMEITIVKRKHLQKYVSRLKEPQRTYRRRSTFGSGNDSQQWVNGT
jgi:hypothetical protein